MVNNLPPIKARHCMGSSSCFVPPRLRCTSNDQHPEPGSSHPSSRQMTSDRCARLGRNYSSGLRREFSISAVVQVSIRPWSGDRCETKHDCSLHHYSGPRHYIHLETCDYSSYSPPTRRVHDLRRIPPDGEMPIAFAPSSPQGSSTHPYSIPTRYFLPPLSPTPS